MQYANFILSNLPLVTIKFTGNNETEENFTDYLNQLSDLYIPKKNIAIIFDATEAKFPSPKFQLKQASWMQTNKEVIETYCKGIAYVIPNTIIRKALQLIFAVYNNKVSFKVFETANEANIWALNQLKIST